ncbi:MAG: DUF1573 domain-containing protein [Opitutales bacterium]|nr:DUF1573 domain-containing protein [Opitutales bacterium]
MNIRLISLSLALLCGVASAAGSLAWESKLFEHTAKPGEERVTATFHFTNAGTAPVEILNLRATCGCTVPDLKKRVYEPGESGEIDVVFTYGSRTGEQNLRVSVFTDQPGQPEQLQLVVNIPQMVELSPRIVYWRRGEPMEPRTVRINVAKEHGIVITQVRPHNNAFAHRLEEDTSGNYTLEITPPSDGERQMGRFDLVSNFPEDNPRVFPVFVGIR